MLEWLLGPFHEILRRMLSFLGLASAARSLEQKGTQIVIKSMNGGSLSIFLQSGWTILDVKKHIGPRLGLEPAEIKIIFAGKELRDDVSLDACDLGSQSILHAVRILARSPLPVQEASRTEDDHPPAEVGGGGAPLCESLIDLQLSGEERAALAPDQRESRRAHFYVWCNSPCNSLQTGKLRVRCGRCQEGAIVLERDPCDWDDVLRPDRISGSCASPSCNCVTSVQFYFKCGNKAHVGSDPAPPLYLIKSNIRDVPCLACGDVCDPVVVLECGDRHVICTSCFADYARSRLNERQFVLDPNLGYTLPCPVGCPDSLIREPRHFHLLGTPDYDRYQRFGAEELVLQSGGVLCPQPGCGAGILPELSDNCRRVGCGECDYVFCRDCLQGAHLGPCLPCGDLGAGAPEGGGSAAAFSAAHPQAARASWLGADPSSVTIRVITKPCPNCRTPTERDGGCMHMICTKPGCSLHWCWVCQVEWSRDCMANHWFG